MLGMSYSNAWNHQFLTRFYHFFEAKQPHFLQQNRQSLSPLPLRCYRQSLDYQIVLQGGNGDKGFKNYV